MLTSKIDSIRNDIAKLNQIGGFKKRVTEYEKINKDLNDCFSYLKQLSELMLNVETEDAKEIEDIDDNEYHTTMAFIMETMNDFENCTIEDQIKIYEIITKKMASMSKYLENRKMEIETIV